MKNLEWLQNPQEIDVYAGIAESIFPSGQSEKALVASVYSEEPRGVHSMQGQDLMNGNHM